jgi:6-phospho-beta-glucosidase
MTFNEINNQANYEEDFAPFTNSGIAYQEGEDRASSYPQDYKNKDK